jgi:hypothetical protein
VGWIRWWWDDSVKPVTEHYSGLLEPQCAALVNADGVKALRVTRRPATEDERLGITQSPEGALVQPMPGVPLLLYDVQLVRKVIQNRPRVAAVPAEQVWIDPDAEGTAEDEDARGVFIVTESTVGDLVALGFRLEDVRRWAEDDYMARTDKVTRRRDRIAARATRDNETRGDDATRRLTYTEGWIRVDYDGDGIAELRRVQAVGHRGEHIIAHQPAERVQIARFVPFAVAHKAIGQSYADRVGDLQTVGSHVMRNILDSMVESIHPRTVIKDGAVPIDDVLNTEMGAVLRERETGAIRELTSRSSAAGAPAARRAERDQGKPDRDHPRQPGAHGRGVAEHGADRRLGADQRGAGPARADPAVDRRGDARGLCGRAGDDGAAPGPHAHGAAARQVGSG